MNWDRHKNKLAFDIHSDTELYSNSRIIDYCWIHVCLGSAVNNFSPQLASRAGKMEKLPARIETYWPKNKKVTYGKSVGVYSIGVSLKLKNNKIVRILVNFITCLVFPSMSLFMH